MIPIKLSLKNFLAYRNTQTLDLSEIHVACLTGENGAGKSAILDAMTWALWGKARTRQDDDLIHLGEDEMEVAFNFELGGEEYRVVRRRSSAKRGKSELHFHGFVPDAGDWRTLSENSIRQTQEKINRLLHLDYDTFINSAFLLQGRADEFTTKKPADRKQILADILGLGIYDEYEARAAEKVRSYQQDIQIIEAQISQIEQEIGNENVYRQEWEESQNAALDLGKILQETEKHLSELRQTHKELDLKNRQLDDLRQRLSQAKTDIDDLAESLATARQNITTYQQILQKKPEIEAGYAQLQTLKTQVDDWNTRLASFSSLRQERHQLETAITQARTKLETEMTVKQSQYREFEAQANAIDNLQQENAELANAVLEMQKLEIERDDYRQKLTDFAAETARLKTENKQLSAEMEKIKARLTQLEDAGSTCPVCTQPLNDDHRAAVHRQFSTDGKTLGDKYRANQLALKTIESEQTILTQKISQTEKQLKTQKKLQSQLARVEQKLEQAQLAAKNILNLRTEIETLELQLSQADFAPKESAALVAVQKKLAAVAYDAESHEMAKQKLARFTHFDVEFRQLEEAKSKLADAETQVAREQSRYERLLAQTATDRAGVETLTAETSALPQVIAELTKVNAQVDEISRKERLARDAVAAARQKLDYLTQLAKSRTEKEDNLANLHETQNIYKELRGAFGKKGVQALLIEHAIPELEEETNMLLGRMTDGRVNVQFVTQRVAKTSDNTIETLDIRIADELGTRNYELYSGGEAFRVNFAIRIALSKLLARRAGTNLQTLVIDEGFGTQDARGRERLVEAINGIQTDFEKILVITHIEELQSAFPVHILVQKTDEGSQISVI